MYSYFGSCYNNATMAMIMYPVVCKIEITIGIQIIPSSTLQRCIQKTDSKKLSILLMKYFCKKIKPESYQSSRSGILKVCALRPGVSASNY